MFGPNPIDPLDPNGSGDVPLPPTEPGPADTTLPAPPPDTLNPECVWVVRPNDSVSLIASTVGGVTTSELTSANHLGRTQVIHVGDLLDICPANLVDDITEPACCVPTPR